MTRTLVIGRNVPSPPAPRGGTAWGRHSGTREGGTHRLGLGPSQTEAQRTPDLSLEVDGV